MWKKTVALLCLLVGSFPTWVLAEVDGFAPWIEQAKLIAADGGEFESFGISVAVDGDTALVGANGANVGGNPGQGAVYVFVRDGTGWSEQAKLTASDGAAFNSFGTSVALEGDTAVIGADSADVDGSLYQGAVYVFTRNGGLWSQQAKLVASDGASEDEFGRSVALSGDTILAGAPSTDVAGNSNQGAAYVFTRDGGDWSEQGKLVAADGAAGDALGRSVALDADTALVGAWRVHHSQGAAYVFTRDGGGWHEQARLAASDGAQDELFGISVDVRDDMALVGAFGAVVDGAIDQGAVYVFTRHDEIWSEQSKLVASDGQWGDNFGRSVALDGDTVLVGAPGVDSFQGAAYLFIHDDGTWTQQARLVAGDGDVGGAFVGFGVAAALSGDTALAGASSADVGGNAGQGAAYVFVQAPDFGTLEGVVSSVQCGGNPVSLSNAAIEIVGQQANYTAITDGAGFYQIVLDQSESPLDIAVTAPDHFPELAGGVEFGGSEVVVRDFDLVRDAACITTEPGSLSLELAANQPLVETLTVGNAQGTSELNWAVATAEPAVAQGMDCENAPGLIIHDDGSIESAYTGHPALVSEVVFVDYFTPRAYPSTLRSVCAAWMTDGPETLDFEVVIFADDGPDGAPGTELGNLAATATDIPAWPVTKPAWTRVDISSLGITVTTGGVYIGVRWAPAEPGVWISADESPENPVGFAGGYWWNDHENTWIPLQDPVLGFQGYRALFVRAEEDPAGCLAPSAIEWLSVDPATGSVPAGGTGEIQISVTAAGLTPGEYRASICIESNDPARPLVIVPVTLTVDDAALDNRIFNDRFESAL